MHVKAATIMVEKLKERREILCFFLLTVFHHFDVFYEVMNNHLTYNVIPDDNNNKSGWSSIMWNFKKR